VWAYAVTAFFITDYFKVLFYPALDHTGIKFKK